jgi:uncharacterized cysteine cluster protein YcgN (CxxCxxCC family)
MIKKISQHVPRDLKFFEEDFYDFSLRCPKVKTLKLFGCNTVIPFKFKSLETLIFKTEDIPEAISEDCFKPQFHHEMAIIEKHESITHVTCLTKESETTQAKKENLRLQLRSIAPNLKSLTFKEVDDFTFDFYYVRDN